MLFDRLRDLRIVDVGLAELLCQYSNSKGKYWIVYHGIIDGRGACNYFSRILESCETPFSTFICLNRAAAVAVSNMLKERRAREGRPAICIKVYCTEANDLAESMYRGENIYLQIEEDEAKRRDELCTAAGYVPYSRHLVKIE